MSQTLGGSLIMANNRKFDYCGLQAVECLLELCDQVSVLVFSDEDMGDLKPVFANEKLMIHQYDMKAWENEVKGSYRIAHWQNIAKSHLTTDWHFSSQADEIIHEKSFPVIREAINSNMGNAHFCWRLNLWGNPQTYLNVEPQRKPCSDVVIRLARTKYDSYGDGESLNIDEACSNNFVRDIRIYHMGFVRKRELMNPKIIEMQEKVFDMSGHDKLCDDDENNNGGMFNPWTRFNKQDVAPIPDELPKFIKEWAKERTYPE